MWIVRELLDQNKRENLMHDWHSRKNRSGCYETSKKGQDSAIYTTQMPEKNYWTKQKRKSYKHKLPTCLLTVANS